MADRVGGQSSAAEGRSSIGRSTVGVWLSVVVLAAVAAVALVRTALRRGTTGTLVGLALGLIPLVASVVFFAWLDRPARGRWAVRILAVLWGLGVANLCSSLITGWLKATYRATGGNPEVLAPTAGPTEETLKALGLLVIVMVAGWHLRDVPDGVVLAGLIGVGFTYGENASYLAQDYPQGWNIVVSSLIMRGIVFGLFHSLYTAAAGWGLGRAREGRGWWWAVVGWLMAVAIHALFNAGGLFGPWGIVITVLVFALLAGLLWLIARDWQRTRGGIPGTPRTDGL